MSGKPEVSIFLSSAADVTPEREAAEWIVQRLNGVYGAHVELAAERWERQFYEADRGFQEAIAPMDAFDIVVGILWKHIGGERAAAIYTLIATAKLNDVDPEALARRHAPPHQRCAGVAAGRASAVELAAPVCQGGGMSGMEILVAGVGFEALDAFLSSDDAPPESMQLSDLDGFLTGIAIGPELVMPSEWLPVVWGARSRSSPMAIRRRPSSAPS